MIPKVSAVIVSHRTAEEAVACASSLGREFEREKIPGEIVLVDCGSGENEQARLGAARTETLVLLRENRGYSGGVNAGLARARGSILVLCNADVEFAPGSLAPLVDAASEHGIGAAGPLCTWDSKGRIRMPPGLAPRFWRDFLQFSTGRLPRIDERRFATFARRTLRLWREGGVVDHLTGAVLVVRREVFDRVGRFDESFPFEYEETEWEDRARGAGLGLRFEPRSRVTHLYARSSTRSPQAAASRTTSRRLYARRRYGRLGSRLLELAPRLARSIPLTPIEEPAFTRRSEAWLAISPNPSLIPFAGVLLDEDFALPEQVRSSIGRARLYLRVFRASDGRPIETFLWENAA